MTKQNTMKVELDASVNTIKDLIENDAITEEQGRKVLSQFKKEDLINALLIDDFDDGEGEEELGEEETDIEEIEESVEDSEDTSDVLDAELVEDGDDDFEDVLD